MQTAHVHVTELSPVEFRVAEPGTVSEVTLTYAHADMHAEAVREAYRMRGRLILEMFHVPLPESDPARGYLVGYVPIPEQGPHPDAPL